MNTREEEYRRYQVDIPVINLDVDQRIQEVEKVVECEEDSEKLEDKEAIVVAAKGLQMNIRDKDGKVN